MQLAIQLAKEAKCPMGLYIQELETVTDNLVSEFSELNKARVQDAATSRTEIYCHINPDLSVHNMYHDPNVNERHRITTTRLRLGSHRLKIETGRWSRIPREERLCICGQDIQSEEHVLTQCHLTENIRNSFPNLSFTNVASLMASKNAPDLCKYCHQVNEFFMS